LPDEDHVVAAGIGTTYSTSVTERTMHRKVGHKKVNSKMRGMPGTRPGSAKNTFKGGGTPGVAGAHAPQVKKARPRKHLGNKNVISAMRKG
jgi:hypothetical protein